MESVVATITDLGDPSVGIFSASWTIQCPFNAQEASEEDLDYFRTTLKELYLGYCDGQTIVSFSCENLNDE